MPKSKHVLIFGLDGCRPDAMEAANTPSMDKLIAEGAYAPKAQTGEITISGPGWSDMLTGVWYRKHGVKDNSFEGANYNQYPHLFRRLKERRPDLETASIVNWAPINEEILRDANYHLETNSDTLVESATLDYLASNTPNLLFLQLDDIDAAGHKHGYAPDSQGYLDSIAESDRIIGVIWQALTRRPTFPEEDWLLLVSTDHGGSGFGHGADIPEHRTIFIIAHAEKPPVFPEEVHIVDIPMLVAKHLEIEVDPVWEWEGRAY